MTKTYDPTVGHGSLLLKVMNYREKPYDELPEELKTQVKRACNPSWDNLNADERLHSALMHDRQNDQDLEEAVCWELDRFLEEAEASEKKARAKVELNSTDQASDREFRIWGDVQKRLNSILDDRARVGSEIQELKRNAGEYEKLENEVIQLRAKNAELKKNNNPALTFHPCKDDTKDEYAPHLAIALKLWEEFYLEGKKPEGLDHTPAGKDWLESEDPSIKKTSRARIASVTNPGKNKNSGDFADEY